MKRFTAILLVLLPVSAPLADDPLSRLPKCYEESTAAAVGWIKTLAPHRDIGMLLPPSLTLAKEQPQFMHGGALWSGPGLEVTVTYGVWNLSSFDHSGAISRCQPRINGIERREIPPPIRDSNLES